MAGAPRNDADRACRWRGQCDAHEPISRVNSPAVRLTRSFLRFASARRQFWPLIRSAEELDAAANVTYLLSEM